MPEERGTRPRFGEDHVARLGFVITDSDSAPKDIVTIENNLSRISVALQDGTFDLDTWKLSKGLGWHDDFKSFLQGLKKREDGSYEWYKSEAMSWPHIVQTFLGQEWQEPESDDEDDDEDIVARARKSSKAIEKAQKIARARAKKVKETIPNPSVTPILGQTRKFSDWMSLRDKARKDLFWLGVTVLKKSWVAEVHQTVCDQFVKKNFDGAYHSGYTLDDVHNAFDRQERFDISGRATKELLLLDSRGFYKSTIDGVDCIQWMLNVPDIRITIVTATKPLARDFMKEIKNYLFYQPENEANTSLDLHLLFPEYVLTKKPSETNTPLLLRVRKHWQKDKTVAITSMESGQAGMHCDVMKRDDCVNEINCQTKPTRELLNSKIDHTKEIPMGWGFIDNIGTRYYPDDWYGTRIAVIADSPLKYFRRACWTVKPEFEKVPLKQLTLDMVTLTFPQREKNAFQVLRDKLVKNETEFRCQQLNEPVMESQDDQFKIAFTIDELRRATIHPSLSAKEGNIYIAWDTAYSKNKQSDYSAGVAAKRIRRDNGRWGLEILEVRHGKWTSSELAQQIAQMDKDWNPVQTIIEKTINAELLELRLQEWYKRLDFLPRIWWREPSMEPDAKRNRIKQLEILLVADLLKFVFGVAKKALDWIEPTFDQLTAYTGERKNRGRKDDIPDAMSMLWYFLPLHVPTTEEVVQMEKRQQLLWQARARQDWQKAVFGGWGTQKPQQQASLIPNLAPSIDPRRGPIADAGKRFLGPGFRI